MPWGISESAYAFTDRDGNYQYRAFGVPGLGLKRGLADRPRHRPLRDGAGQPGHTRRAAAENFERLARARRSTVDSASTKRSITTPRSRDVDTPPDAQRPTRPSSAPTSRTIRACRSSRSPTSSASDVFVARFHADPRVQATELLLQERVPREAILSEPRPAESTTAPPSLPVFASRRFRSPHTTSAHTHFLSNGRYRTAVTNAGGGFSMWRDVAVTRRRDDPTSDAGAHYIYLRDPWSSRVWSATYQPVCQEPDQFEAIFDLDKITFRRRDADIETQLEITVSSEDDVEVRRLTITNRGAQTREIEVTSYAEIVLARPEDDLAHPAFGKLFVETEFDAQSAGLLFSRRPRASDESTDRGLSMCSASMGRASVAPSSGRPTGRGSSAAGVRVANPIVLDGRALSGTTGAVLDPDRRACASAIRLAPGAVVRVAFATGVAPDRAAALTLARKYRDGSAAARAFSMAFTHVHITLQHLGLSDEHAMLFDRLASRVFGSDTSLHQPRRPRRQYVAVSRICGATASPAICRSCSSASLSGDVAAARAPAAQGAGVLARQRTCARTSSS